MTNSGFLGIFGYVVERTTRSIAHGRATNTTSSSTRYVWHGRERLGLLRVRGDVIALHGLLWPDEIRAPAAMVPPPVQLDEDEIDEAMALIEA